MNLSIFSKACCLALSICTILAFGQTQTQNVSPAGTKFLLYTPPAYSPSTPSPLLICLHGGNEIGDDLNELTVNTPHLIPSRLIYLGQWSTTKPFIVVTPQLKRDPSITNFNDQEWPATLIDEVVEFVRTNYNVDPNRIYFTGISLGGAGGWDYITAYPGKVAAFVPFSGKTRTEYACNVKDTPIWAFHGEVDPLVKPKFTVDMINAINACSPAGKYKPRLNLLHGKGHEGWSEVYNETQGYDIYNWLLQFSLGNNANKAPYVNAGIDQKILLRSDPVELTGDYFDSDGTIANVTWSKISGPSVTLDQSNLPFLKLTNLNVGTYQFELRVRDNQGVEKADQVMLEVLSAVGTESVITNIVLVDAKNGNVDIGNLSEGMVINKNVLGTDEFNFRATVSGTTGSVRFRVSSDQHTSTTNTPGPYYLKKTTQTWPMPNGDYIICASPYKQSGGKGTPGVSLLFKVTVIGTTPTFYSKANSDISQLSSWGTNTNGTGSAPTSFTTAGQTFYINNAVTVDHALTINGDNSSLLVKSAGQLTINSALTAVLNTEGNAIVNIYTSQSLVMGNISATSTINFYGTNTIPSGTYGSLDLKGTGTTKSLPSNTVTVSGNLIIESGVTLNGNAGNLSVGGNITNNGTLTPATSTVKLNGVTNQTLTGSLTFNKLTLSKSGGNVTLSGTGPTTISSVLTLTAGNIISSSTNKLTLSSGATISGGSSSSFIIGPIVKVIPSGGAFVFPLGSISPTQYRPTTLANTTASDTWTAEYKAHDPSTDGYSHTTFNHSYFSSVNQFEYWNISRLGSTAAALTLSYNTGSYSPPNIGEVSKLRIAHWDGTKWDLPSGGGSLSQSGTSTSGTVTVTNITSFSPLTTAMQDAPLPVKWRSFTANRTTEGVALLFETAQERNNDHFDIERSVDGVTFNFIGQKSGAGNTDVAQHYRFVDPEVSDHLTYYYRIKQVDYDNQFDYSNIIAVQAIGKAKARWLVWPNPLGDEHSLQVEQLEHGVNPTELISVKVIAPNGAVLFHTNDTFIAIALKLTQVFSNVSPGVYTIQFTDNTHRENFRIARF